MFTQYVSSLTRLLVVSQSTFINIRSLLLCSKVPGISQFWRSPEMYAPGFDNVITSLSTVNTYKNKHNQQL